MNKRRILLTLSGIIILIITSITYAFVRGGLVSGNSIYDNILINSDYDAESEITVSYDESDGFLNASFSLERADAGTDKVKIIKFSIENELNKKNYVSIDWKNVSNNFCEYRDFNYQCVDDDTETYVGDELKYALYECSSANFPDATENNVGTLCTKVSPNYDELAPKNGESFSIQADSKIILAPNEVKYYILALKIKNLVSIQDYQIGSTFSANVEVKSFEGWSGDECEDYPTKLACKITEAYKPVPDNKKSQYVSSDKGIDFAAISSITNGQGLYEDVKNGTNGMIKYFRGNVNNYVSFAGFLWRVIKINEDGSVKIIATNANLTSKIFGSSTSGYTNARSGESLGTDNNIKTVLDDWYFNNLEKKYDSYIESNMFCNDTSGATSAHGPNTRMVTTKVPTYLCPTTTQTYGGTYYLKIGTLTADEAMYAGGVYNVVNNDYYLKDGVVTWTMSPNTNAQNWFVNTNGSLNVSASSTAYAIRPVINLKANLFATGAGTSENPWVISKENISEELNSENQNIEFTGAYRKYKAPKSGKYKIELWGAQGGSNLGGKGSYAAGEVYLNISDYLFFYVGNQPSRNENAFNGGGSTNNTHYPSDDGGGATDVRLTAGDTMLLESLKSRIMVAAAGGGAEWYQSGASGGDGGGLYGNDGKYTGSIGSYHVATGATQFNGGKSDTALGDGPEVGKFGSGGNGGFTYGGGGGGSGYYGGGGGSNASHVSSGGSGSSFISGHTGCVAISISGNEAKKLDSNGVLCDSSSSAGYNASGYNTDPLCSEHYSGKVFTETLMIDGAGYKWEIIDGALVKTLQQMPNPLGGYYASGVGHAGNGYAKITYLGS